VDTFARDRLPPVEQWPVLLLDRPELRYPARLNCAVELVDRMVDAGRSDAVAFRSPTETLTYGELRDRVDRIARVLVEDLVVPPGSSLLGRGVLLFAAKSLPTCSARMEAGDGCEGSRQTRSGGRR
jgi:2-aminobenzoate-CoA ligase